MGIGDFLTIGLGVVIVFFVARFVARLSINTIRNATFEDAKARIMEAIISIVAVCATSALIGNMLLPDFAIYRVMLLGLAWAGVAFAVSVVVSAVKLIYIPFRTLWGGIFLIGYVSIGLMVAVSIHVDNIGETVSRLHY